MSQMSGPPQRPKGSTPSYYRVIFTKKWIAHPRTKNAIYRRRQLDMTGFQMQGGTAVFCDDWQDDRMDKRCREFEEKEKRGGRVIHLAHGVVQEVGPGPGEVSLHASECKPLAAEAPRLQESGNTSNSPEDNPPREAQSPRRSAAAECESLHPPSSAFVADCTESFPGWSNAGVSMQEPARPPQAALYDVDSQCPWPTRTISSADPAQRTDLLLYESMPPLVGQGDDATNRNDHQADLTALNTDGKLQGKGLDYWARVLENRISLVGN
ncbi:hypothetical protein BDV24DRAFT_163972 [Aspergillus arachidicola]|uniref:Uncharacterized protein n=1 Tax=Aspergillus arachidicola TaxID=656916 RepID=A0A5N6Y7E9_9EURO|nr:hypothetical protein BDV24DRAFT_163972 [Aspergillus arachidicola]